ncbi:hypothetical protein K470DRAFT_263915 [Piedraia hortae CBS 480.64]|uniref:Uncharacterized protein n=1 Tax=Piedraia hortae CBS 480.64 TaxID=1314780 RepID=A0A6A7C2Z6_9PEZI|nr:hypothetical protein K470DRAFT_263915 [Piedraia hortae CBS 480.64]
MKLKGKCVKPFNASRCTLWRVYGAVKAHGKNCLASSSSSDLPPCRKRRVLYHYPSEDNSRVAFLPRSMQASRTITSTQGKFGPCSALPSLPTIQEETEEELLGLENEHLEPFQPSHTSLFCQNNRRCSDIPTNQEESIGEISASDNGKLDIVLPICAPASNQVNHPHPETSSIWASTSLKLTKFDNQWSASVTPASNPNHEHPSKPSGQLPSTPTILEDTSEEENQQLIITPRCNTTAFDPAEENRFEHTVRPPRLPSNPEASPFEPSDIEGQQSTATDPDCIPVSNLTCGRHPVRVLESLRLTSNLGGTGLQKLKFGTLQPILAASKDTPAMNISDEHLFEHGNTVVKLVVTLFETMIWFMQRLIELMAGGGGQDSQRRN